MFRFIKTKKGFSLVELMIVVVIMAILVAVAIPIYNSVTGNAREKTCLDNQRQIMSAVSRIFSMSAITGVKDKQAKINFYTNANGGKVIEEDGTDTVANLMGESTEVTLDTIKNCFQTIPVCGDETKTITLTITANLESFADVEVECSDENHKLS